jgi:uncharacterized membrane protein YkoI
MKSNRIALYLAVAALISTAAFSAQAYTGQALEKNTKISMAQAVVIALKTRPGQITDKELEREGGGSGLRYSFDVKSGGVMYEVVVDTQTGEVLENNREGANAD